MPKKGNPTASDSNFKEPRPVPRIKLFKEERLNLFDILKDADKPLHKDYRYKKDEIFKRMKVTTFVQLVVQVAEYDMTGTPSYNGSERPDTADDEVYRIQRGGGDRSPAPSLALTEGDFGAPAPMATNRSTLQGVIKGEGELDRNRAQNNGSLERKVLDGCPYLLLDIRDKDSFDQCHIITAKNYPSAMLSRACNYETKDMLAFRNQPGKIIIVYDETEQLAPNCVSTLVQRGYDNIFLLSGGMKVAYKIFPEGLFTGHPPVAVTETPRQPNRTYESANREKFTMEDLEKIGIYLDNALCDKSSGSRLSKASTASSRMSNFSTARSTKPSQTVATGRASHQTPFKP
ncbi:centrosomal protein of 41 kDa A-like isoform X2 [Dreissena polymorpha]|uniref:centrosomal protein of 41 kDa A-like isoform X2 n=1 Tax=Dreissena polymorpha TaxID=45954 RepID=UPI002264F487|nr:centrosomal protein of 41 kDa A-like isoform X2 [Dreissena polymorpha]